MLNILFYATGFKEKKDKGKVLITILNILLGLVAIGIAAAGYIYGTGAKARVQVYLISEVIIVFLFTINGLRAIIKNKRIVEGKISGFALLDNCITVGGIINSRYEKKPYKYSSGGIVTKTIKPNFVAAASNIVSLNCDPSYISVRNGLKVYPRKLQEQYTTYSGTSISAAYIAGICAIILEIIPELKPVDVHAILKFCSENIDLPKHLQGYGQISISKLHDKLDRVNKESKRKKY